MKVSRTFVKGFLGMLLVVLVGNIAALTLGAFRPWMAYSFVGLSLILFFLIFRKHKIGFIKFLAWTLPVIFVLVILYINFLPFGFTKTYNVYVLNDGKVISDSSRVYLEDSKGKQITNLTNVYDYGTVYLVVKPYVILKNASVFVNLTGEDVYFPLTNFNVSNISWDYNWDFTKKVPLSLNGTAKYDREKGCVYFNGSLNQTLNYPESKDMFENDSFVIYARWNPEDSVGKSQQIVGHYNWELWQNNDSVRFMIGRLENKTGSMPSVSYKINSSEFFNQNHSALLVYSPENISGYIELYVDNSFAGRAKIQNQTIWKDYNGDRNLSFGWSSHNYGNNSYYTGCIYSAGFDYSKIKYSNQINFSSSDKVLKVPILGAGNVSEIKMVLNQ